MGVSRTLDRGAKRMGQCEGPVGEKTSIFAPRGPELYVFIELRGFRL